MYSSKTKPPRRHKEKKMKKILTIILCMALMLTSVAAFTSCGSKGKTLDEIKAAGKLVVATSPDFPPFENLENGKIVGIEPELITLIGEKLGVEVEIKSISFDAILTGVESGKYDCGVAGISIDPERAKNTLFTDPYCLAAQCIVVPAGSNITCKADLEGKKIAVQTGTTAAKFCAEQGYTLSQFEANQDAKLALTQGKVDAWVVDDLSAAEMTKGDSSLVILDEAMTSEPYAFAFAFGSEDLVAEINMIINELIADGTVKALFDKYDAPYTKPTNK